MSVKRFLFLISFLLISINSFSQSVDAFRNDFKKAVTKLSDDELNHLFKVYDDILTPSSDVTQLTIQLKGHSISQFPLESFKHDTLYTNNINKLLNSQNNSQRILAYLVIASSGDSSKEDILLKKIKTETDTGCLIWSGMALLYLGTSHTTALFDFLVQYEDFGDAHMIPLYFKLNKDSLQQTAYARIHSDNVKAKVLGAQTLSFMPLNPKTDTLLRQAIKDWDINIKGYAIYPVKVLQMGHLLSILKPLLDSSQTRSIAFDALANSPTPEDHAYLVELINKSDTVSEDILDCFFNSDRIDNLKYWLKLLYTKPIPSKYIFLVFKQPLLSTDNLLSYLQVALQKIKDPDVLGELVRAMNGRTDSISTDIMITLIHNNSSSVRYWTAVSLVGNHSPKLAAQLPQLLKDTATTDPSLTELIIGDNIDTLQQFYENVYNTSPIILWKEGALDYLSTFPLTRDKELFKQIIEIKMSDGPPNKVKNDYTGHRYAAIGLARLNDNSEVDYIISACENERKRSDINCETYLVALGMIKGEKARDEIEKFEDSDVPDIRTLVNSTLNGW